MTGIVSQPFAEQVGHRHLRSQRDRGGEGVKQVLGVNLCVPLWDSATRFAGMPRGVGEA